MSDRKVGVAVIGLGFVGGQAHVPSVKRIEGAELAAVVDLEEAVAKDIAARFETKLH